MQQTSYLLTRSTTQNLAGTVNKLPRRLLLRFHWPSTFLLYRINIPTMEDMGITNPENQPLLNFMMLVVRLCMMDHPFGFNSLLTQGLLPHCIQNHRPKGHYLPPFYRDGHASDKANHSCENAPC